ncbi:MAG: hypothetical protein AB2L14_25425 [Candidatus Xenobiia bacterium LiM19]
MTNCALCGKFSKDIVCDPCCQAFGDGQLVDIADEIIKAALAHIEAGDIQAAITELKEWTYNGETLRKA